MSPDQLPGQSQTAPWKRVLSPLVWWLVLVLILFGIRTHQRLLQQTRVIASVTLAGNSVHGTEQTSLDGQPFSMGDLVSLGNHTFSVTHPKGETFSTNLFIWYGEHDLGRIDLKRAKGILALTVDPPAPLLSIHGPEFTVTLTNSSGISNSVPTDQYWVEARYLHWSTGQQFMVQGTIKNSLAIAPKLGVLQLRCNQNDATFGLLQSDRPLENGKFPATIVELPEGTYQLAALHHGHRWEKSLEVKSGATNETNVEFHYGRAVLETKPSGAKVTSSDGKNWGVTPVNIAELIPGTYSLTFRLDNYEPISVPLEIVANETKTVSQNLVSQSYSGAMRAARQHMASANFDLAIEALGDALRSQPNDAAATSLLREATGLGSLRRAETLGKKGDYIAGIKELDVAFASLPDNEQAKNMLADFKKHEPAQRETMRLERLNRPRAAFEAVLATIPNSALFEVHEFKSIKPYKELENAIINAFQNQKPPFKVLPHPSPKPETFYIEAVLELSTYLATSAGRRQCIIVGGQTQDDETQILLKILEYKTEAQIKFSIGNLIGTPVAVDYVPLHPSRGAITEKLQARLSEGISNVTATIRAGGGYR